ncbi:ANTAR domain-containing protein [Streptomyces sp. NPDC004561]
MASPTRPDATPATADRRLRAEVERLRSENRQLQQALASHAVVDQAIGVLTVMTQMSPDDGFTVLREVSQRTNIKLSAVAEHILERARGSPLPEAIQVELHAALTHYAAEPPTT